MGKPYAEELDRLPDTYLWAMAAPVEPLLQASRAAASLPLVAVGSGGSLTTAEFAAAVHRQYTSGFAMAMTPLEAVGTPQSLRASSVLLLTAGGKNPDIIGAFHRLVAREPRRLMVLCASSGSPIARLAAEHPYVDFAEFEVPSGKDGFLATNSLLASAVLLVRSYSAMFTGERPLPDTLPALLEGRIGAHLSEELDRRCWPLWERETLVVLHGPETHPAAVDVESKFAEAALGTVQRADYRNFAHGRHHWLAKRGDKTGVLAIITDEDRELAEAMLALLPGNVPVVRLDSPGQGVAACLAALAQVFFVAGSAGRAHGIDPGDPGVPAFGRKIYHLRAFGSRERPGAQVPPGEMIAIERKSGATVVSLLAQGWFEEWRTAYRNFVARLATASFRGVVLDYDGTLCDEAHRFKSLSTAVGRQLNRLLRAGVVLGVATGRGKSARQMLRDAVDHQLWRQVVVGYYNGGDIGLLSDDARPDGTEVVNPALATVAQALRADARLLQLVKLTFRGPQITIEPRPEAQDDHLWQIVQHLLHNLEAPGVVALRSSHSMDIIAPGVCKRAVVERVSQMLGAEADFPILCIGDRGLWPGNDCFLLSGRYSLSVDEVSPDPGSCWNLAPPGHRGPQATLGYLERLEATEGGLRLVFD